MTINNEGVVDRSGNNPNVLKKIPSIQLSKSFGATGVSDWVFVKGKHPVYITGFGSATIKMERSPDGGTTIVDVVLPDGTTPASFTAEASFDVDGGEQGSLLRFNCTVYGSGTIACSIGDSV